MLRCRSIASLRRTVSTPPLVDFRAPHLWIFLSSLQEVFFSSLLGIAGCCLGRAIGIERWRAKTSFDNLKKSI
jgi:hypothetical protein